MVATAAVGLGLVAAAYLVARETPLFGLREVSVAGAPGEVEREVKAVLQDLRGTSLVKLDASQLEEQLLTLPSVLDASVDRAFPHELRIRVDAEEPLAVVRYDGAAWVVSRRGRVVRPRERGSRLGLPRIWSATAPDLAPGEFVGDATALTAIAALAAVPEAFPVRIRGVRGDDQTMRLVLTTGTEIRLGSTDDLSLKLRAAQAVLASLSPSERGALTYLDVSLPQRPVGSAEPQVSVESLD